MEKWVPLVPFPWAWIVSDKNYLRIFEIHAWKKVEVFVFCFKYHNSQWRAATSKFSFSRFFFITHEFSSWKSFKIFTSIFLAKNAKNLHIIHLKKYYKYNALLLTEDHCSNEGPNVVFERAGKLCCWKLILSNKDTFVLDIWTFGCFSRLRKASVQDHFDTSQH